MSIFQTLLLLYLTSLPSILIVDAEYFNLCNFHYGGWNYAFSRCLWSARHSSITANLMDGVFLMHKKNNGDGLQLQSSIQNSPMCEGEAAKQLPKCNPELQPGYELHMYTAFWRGKAMGVSGYASKKGTNEVVHFSATTNSLWVNNERKTAVSGKVTVGGTQVEWFFFDPLNFSRISIVVTAHATQNYLHRDEPWSNEKYNSHENVRYLLHVPMDFTRWYAWRHYDQGESIGEGLCGTAKPQVMFLKDDTGFTFPTNEDNDQNTCPCRRNMSFERMKKILGDKKELTTDNFHLYDEVKSYWMSDETAKQIQSLITCHNDLMLDTNIVTDDDNVCPNTELTNEASSGLASMWNIVPFKKQICIDSRESGLIDDVILYHSQCGGENEILHSPLEVQSYLLAMKARMVKCSLAAMCLDQVIAIDDAESIWIEYCRDGVFSTELQLESNLNRDNQQDFQATVESAFDIGFTACASLGDLIQVYRTTTSTMAPTTTTTLAPTTTTTTTTTASPGGRVRRRLLANLSSDNDILFSPSEYEIQYNSLQELASIRRNCASIQPEPSDWIKTTEISVAIQNCVVYYDSESPQDSLFFANNLFELAEERKSLSENKENRKVNYLWFYIAAVIGALCAAGFVAILFMWRNISLLRHQHNLQVALINGKDNANSAGL